MKTIPIFALMVVLTSCSKKDETPVPAKASGTGKDTVTYTNTVKTIISTHCTITCHKSGAAGFAAADLTNYQGVKTEVDAGTFKNRVITLGNMPPSNPLSTTDITKLQAWIDNAAAQ